MKLKKKPLTLSGRSGPIEIKRNGHGIPEISARSWPDLAYGQGWMHALDRQLQTLFTRIILQGRAAELLKNDPALVEIDRYMRTMDFLPDPAGEAAKLEPKAAEVLAAYAQGLNAGLEAVGTVWELRLLGYRPEPWHLQHSLLLAKVFGFLGLVDSQAGMQKLLIEMIQLGIEEEKLRELFPYLSDPIDYDLIGRITLAPPLLPAAAAWRDRLPAGKASNNWVVAGEHSSTGRPILCGDIHLEMNRLPAIWQEVVLRLPDDDLKGVCVPGAPGLVAGASRRLAWSPTYSFMDQLDHRIEHCREGKFRRGDDWRDFTVRREIIKRKGAEPLEHLVYENQRGVLEGDPLGEGYYLTLGWSAKHHGSADVMNGLLGLTRATSVEEGMAQVRRLDCATFCWTMADEQGNIGMQMSGLTWRRPEGVSGLLPTPGWDPSYDPSGFVAKDDLPALYNPPEGFIATSNQDLNHLGKAKVISLAMGAYRAQRVEQLLRERDKCDPAYMKAMHYDLYSPQAERFMALLRPLCPQTEPGRLLRDWDCRYSADSKGATLFEAVYQSLHQEVFGAGGLGREAVAFLLAETPIFNDYYANFDEVMLKADSAWFQGRSQKEVFSGALDQGLATEPQPYGETRRVVLSHLLLGGKLPRALGFDRGPIELPGCRATITQGQIFRSDGRLTTFAPGFRLIADLATGQCHTNLAGGPSDRRFSKLYASDLANWLAGEYKVLE